MRFFIFLILSGVYQFQVLFVSRKHVVSVQIVVPNSFYVVEPQKTLAFASVFCLGYKGPHMYTTHTSATAKDLFIRLYAVVQGNILNACHDNGSEFEKEFERQLLLLNIPQYFSRIKTPKDNPVCERFNRTLKEEFLRQGNYTYDVVKFNSRLSKWLLKYNCYRPHQALNYLTPFKYHFNQALVTDVSV